MQKRNSDFPIQYWRYVKAIILLLFSLRISVIYNYIVISNIKWLIGKEARNVNSNLKACFLHVS